MSYVYGIRSRAKLKTCHPLLIDVANRALELSPYDIAIIHGKRDKVTQNKLYSKGKSTKRFPNSRHNKTEDTDHYADPYEVSDALDFGPYVNGIPWEDTHVFAVIAGVFMAAAKDEGIKLRWGGDWNSNGLTTDQTFMDWGHIEINWD